MAEAATHIVSSDLRRAVDSAELLAPNRRVRVSALLREAPLAIPDWPTRLPLGVWDILMHIGWSVRIVRGTDAAEYDRARAAQAAEWLSATVADGSMALVVTHGVFRRLLADHLIGRGWTVMRRAGWYAHWSAWSFCGPA